MTLPVELFFLVILFLIVLFIFILPKINFLCSTLGHKYSSRETIEFES